MTLASRLSTYFGTILRERGFFIYRSGAVQIMKSSPDTQHATVLGTLKYETVIALRNDKLWLSCSCPYAESNGHCKHQWAAVLAASDRKFLSELNGTSGLTVAFGPIEEPKAKPAPPVLSEAPKPFVVPSREPQLLKRLPQAIPPWRECLSEVDAEFFRHDVQAWPATREIHYVIEVPTSRSRGRLLLHLYMRDRSKTGHGWNQLKDFSWPSDSISRLADPVDREIVAALFGATDQNFWYTAHAIGAVHDIPAPLSLRVAEMACRTGRCFMKREEYQSGAPAPLVWDEAGPWLFRIKLGIGKNGRAVAEGELVRGDETMDLLSPPLILPGGLVFAGDKLARVDHGPHAHWISLLRRRRTLEAMPDEAGEMLASLLEHPTHPVVVAAPEIRFDRVELPLQPRFILRPPELQENDTRMLRGEVLFQYGDYHFRPNHYSQGFFVRQTQQYIVRNQEAEAAAKSVLASTPLPAPMKNVGDRLLFKVVRTKVPAIVRLLVQNAWHVETEGKAFRSPVSDSFSVTSGIDWFELHAEFDFGGATTTLPRLLKALRNGETIVALDDGTYGLVPENWIARFAPIAQFGEATGDHVRFRRTQAGLLDALLASQPQARFDEGFARARTELQRFHGVDALPQPDTFVGCLRDYQREGLGWMEFLRQFGFGGCLADDMGVGKTAQVLAMLEARRAQQATAKPSLVVMPRSLIFNWKQEAARFTPQLRVLDHTGSDRDTAEFAKHDVVLTTYGILRRDVVNMRETEFDYVVLDEAQAIKNAASESAKAARLLRAGHRLALSGTPVENHLGELASIFEFLNPGMLGTGSTAQLSGGLLRNPPQETRTIFARALRPFILRRTKQQVARELPPKTEQTLYCEMEAVQRKLYDELRQFYRKSLLGRVDKQGLSKSKIQVLEALLRLRQAACHPGLLDPKRAHDTSAKVATLLAQITQVVAEGHKALVFSQFTSLLALVKPLLDDEQITYEYLDGSTVNRQARVERFQNDKDCPLFLISLKAGGLGLNLTAAEYVYLLDPWWNPAVEAQAIDRTHRIGQTNRVFAYRLITKDTVEEKVLELQKTKRDLASAIIGEDNSLIRDLKREDLELLLG